jgi:large subunit ribosomal protein L6
MSRIGIKPITVPDGVTIAINESLFVAKGPKGENSVVIPRSISLVQKDNVISVERASEMPDVRALHGMVRSHVANAVQGTIEEFVKTLEIQGVGFRAKLAGTGLELTIGFSHQVKVAKPAGITFTVKGNKISVSGAHKGQVGEVAAMIRRIRPPDSYKGKGIRYEGEYIKLKPGKAAKAGAA